MAGPRGDENARKATEVLELVRDLKDTFKARNELFAYTDRVLYMDEPVYIPPSYAEYTVEVRTPLALHAVNTVAAAMSKNYPEVQFDPVNIGGPGQENATLREHFFDGSFQRQEDEADRSFFRPFMYSLVSKGEGVLKTMERRKRWERYLADAPKLKDELSKKHTRNGKTDYQARDREYNQITEDAKRALPYPISTTDVPPENFMFVRGEEGLSTAVEVKQVPYFATLERYGYELSRSGKVVKAGLGLPNTEWSKAMKSSKTRTLTMAEAWRGDIGKVQYLLLGPGDSLDKAGGALVKELDIPDYVNAETGTLRGPYFHAYGITTASRDVATMGVSIVFGFLRLYGLLNSLLTIQGQAAFRYGFSTYKRAAQPGMGMGDPIMSLTPGPASKDAGGGAVKFGPGDIIPWDISPVELGHAGVDLEKAIQLVRQLLDLALPAIVQGVIDDASGYAVSQASHLARLIWDPIVRNAEAALRKRVGFESHLIETCIGEDVYAFGSIERQGYGPAPRGELKIGPKDLNHIHRYRVRLEPDTPSNEVIKLRAIAQAMQLRVMGPYQAITELGRNPDEVEHEWLVWDLKQDPRVKGKLIGRALTKLGIEDQQLVNDAMTQLAPDQQTAGDGADALGNTGEVYQAGQNLPLEPTPAGTVAGGTPGAGAGGAAETPVVPNPRGVTAA